MFIHQLKLPAESVDGLHETIGAVHHAAAITWSVRRPIWRLTKISLDPGSRLTAPNLLASWLIPVTRNEFGAA